MAKASELVTEAANALGECQSPKPPFCQYGGPCTVCLDAVRPIVALVLRRAAEAIGAGPAYCEHGTPAADDLRQLADDVEEGR